jgi:ribosome biogenesis protein YTM1
MLWEWNVSTNAVECIHVCRGHERGLECVGISRCQSQMATGGWDTKLKIWSAGKVLPTSRVLHHTFVP